jgi:hypothetical protein
VGTLSTANGGQGDVALTDCCRCQTPCNETSDACVAEVIHHVEHDAGHRKVLEVVSP